MASCDPNHTNWKDIISKLLSINISAVKIILIQHHISISLHHVVYLYSAQSLEAGAIQVIYYLIHHEPWLSQAMATLPETQVEFCHCPFYDNIIASSQPPLMFLLPITTITSSVTLILNLQVSSYWVYPQRCFQKDYEYNVLPCPDCQHPPLVSISSLPLICSKSCTVITLHLEGGILFFVACCLLFPYSYSVLLYMDLSPTVRLHLILSLRYNPYTTALSLTCCVRAFD